MNITVTTCLYDIRKKEQSDGHWINTLKDYLELSRHMLRLRLPMVIFTDEEEIVDYVYKTRLEYGLLDKTLIARLPFEQTFFYRDLETLKQRMKEFSIVNWNKDKDTPLYILLNNNKFDFLKRSMEMNVFHTDFFLWMDMGIQHCTKATEQEWLEISETWPSFIHQDREHIHQLRIHTVTKPSDMTWKDYFRMIYHHVAGGLFGGHKDRVYEYIQLFQEQWHKILYEEKWWQLDEAIMTIITETYPEKFRFFYGDYDGLLSNFLRSQKSFELIMQTAQRYLDGRKNQWTEDVLSTLDFDNLLGTGYYERVLSMKICNDYHLYHGKMSPVLFDVLNRHEIPQPILIIQVPNIRHLSDPRLWQFFAKWAFQNPLNQWAFQRWQEHSQDDNVYWQPFGSFSKKILHPKTKTSPFDSMEENPEIVLQCFQSQFESFPESCVCSFYNLLEQTDQKIVFVLSCTLYEEEDFETYDRSVMALFGFLKRNFPQLMFSIMLLCANRTWTVPIDQTPPELFIFSFETPYSFHKNVDFFTQVVSAFLSMIYPVKESFITKEDRFYGQHQEDVFLATLFPKNYQGVCVDVGAYDGVGMSNTLYFEERGWRCLCIEPIYEEFLKCSQIRKETFNCCIAEADKEDEQIFTVYKIGDSTAAISSLQPDPRLIQSHQHILTSSEERSIKVRSLTSVLDEAGFPRCIDFISIDTENTELDVLKGLDFSKYKVRCFIIENNFNEPMVEDYLYRFGYKKIYRIAVNDFFMLEREPTD